MHSLVAAPHTERKHGSFPLWAAATDGYDRLLAIETTEARYADHLLNQYGVLSVLFVPGEVRVYGPHRICGDLYNHAWDAILSRVHRYTHILSLDTDVIPSGDILKLMESEYGEEDFLIHGVPWRESYERPGEKAYETSCTFAATEKWREALALAMEAPHRQLYRTVRSSRFTHRDIDIMHLDHLEQPDAEDGGKEKR